MLKEHEKQLDEEEREKEERRAARSKKKGGKKKKKGEDGYEKLFVSEDRRSPLKTGSDDQVETRP
ncbi:unnamed protein product [Anisakis simplex]|uniref:Uncharacterized protein n=1 Tax=Anisakis simplex TaxID=6269 RepID=A0A3P6PLC9_ANISI|nr:unnamed protein product [Anisakis simplex]